MRIFLLHGISLSLLLIGSGLCGISTGADEIPPKATSPVVLQIPLLASPITSTELNSLTDTFLPRFVGNEIEMLSQQYPFLNRSPFSRTLEWLLTIAWEEPWNTLNHELGHYRALHSFNFNAQIKTTGWNSAFTTSTDPNVFRDDTKLTVITSAGLNQQQLNAMTIFNNWAKDGSISYQEAISYLISRVTLPLYCIGSAYSHGNRLGDDVSDYLLALGNKVPEYNSLIGAAALPLMASASFWAAILGQAEFLRTGQRRIPIPALELGPLRLIAPEFHTLLTSQGPLIGGTTFFMIGNKLPIELSIDVRGHDSAAAVSLKAYDFSFFSWLRLSPFARVSFYSNAKSGFMLGSDVTIILHKRLHFIVRLNYQYRDLLAEPLGHQDGLNLLASLGVILGR